MIPHEWGGNTPYKGLNETNRKKLIDALLSTFNEKRK